MSLSFSNDYNCFRNRYSMPLERIFGDRKRAQSFFSPELLNSFY